MKKAVCILMFAVMVFALTACSSEITNKYLMMSKDVCSESFNTTGNISVVVGDLSGLWGEQAKKVGLKDINIEYSVDADANKNMDILINCDIHFNNKNVQIKDIGLQLIGNKVYIGKRSLVRVIEGLKCDNDTELILNAVKKLDANAVMLSDAGDVNVNIDYSKLLVAFKDVSIADMIKEEGNEIVISGTIERALKLYTDSFKVLSDAVESKTNDANMIEVIKLFGGGDVIKDCKNLFTTDNLNEVASSIVKNSTFECREQVVNGALSSKDSVTIKFGENTIAEIKSTSISTKLDSLDLSMYMYKSVVDIDSFSSKVMKEKALRDYVNGVDITWYNMRDEGEINLNANVGFFYDNDSTNEVSVEYVIDGDRIYLPLRVITEGCGYDVTWDGQSAFVKVGSKQVQMDGILKNNKTYVKIIDFEKLGWRVEYINNANLGENVVRLTLEV